MRSIVKSDEELGKSTQQILCLQYFMTLVYSWAESWLGEGCCPFGTRCIPAALELLLSDWPKPGKPAIVHTRNLLSALYKIASVLHPFACSLLTPAWMWASQLNKTFFCSPPKTVFSASPFSVVFDQDHCILPILGRESHSTWHGIFFSVLAWLLHTGTWSLHL